MQKGKLQRKPGPEAHGSQEDGIGKRPCLPEGRG